MRSLNIEPYILSQTNDLYVLNKPPGWPTTGRKLEDDDCIQFHLMRHHGGMVWALHQLDADTSGLCFFTTRKDWVQPIKELWSHPETSKQYLAITHATPDWIETEVDAPIGKNDLGQLGVQPDGKSARTHFKVLDSKNGYSLLRTQLFTGRTHQIRIHLQHLGYSLVGEEWYRNAPCTEHPRQALHAYRIQLPENTYFEASDYIAPPPEDFQQLADQLSLDSTRITDKKSSSP